MSGTRAISSRRINKVTTEAVVEYLDAQYTPTKAQKRILKKNARNLQKRYAGHSQAYRSIYDDYDKVNQNLASTFSIIPMGANQTIFADWGMAALELSYAQNRIINLANNPASPVAVHYITMEGVSKNAKDYVARSVKEYWRDDKADDTPALNQLVDLIFKNADKDSLKRLTAAWNPNESNQKRMDESVAYNKKDHTMRVKNGWDEGHFDEANARFEAFGYTQWPQIGRVLQGIISQGIQDILDADTIYAPNAAAKHLLVDAILESEHTQDAKLLTALYINQTYLDMQTVNVEAVASYQPESRGHYTTSQPPTMVRYYDVRNPTINNEYLARMVVPVHDWWGKGYTNALSHLAQRILKEHTKVMVATAKAQIEQQTAQEERQYEHAKQYAIGEQGYLTIVGKLVNEMIQSDDSKLPETFVPHGQVTFKTSDWIEWTGGMDKLESAIRSLLNRNVANRKQGLAQAKKQYERTLKQRRDTLKGLKE